MGRKKKSHWYKALIATGILIGVLYVVGRLTHAIQFYSVPTINNYPNLQPGNHLLVSNLSKPKRFDFICYQHEGPLDGKQTYIHRLCGLPGDKVAIKMGKLYVNDRYADTAFTLAHRYRLLPEDFDTLNALVQYDEYLQQQDSNGRYIVYVSDQQIREKDIKAERQILPPTHEDAAIADMYGQAWNQDNFGPVVVPASKYFVLGDNRLYAQDSRYMGFIDSKDYLGKLIFSF
jgi:signal peptidase I